jgi:tRNA threonylcarbamoyl adenosine modification protein YjeE
MMTPANIQTETHICQTPDETFELGRSLGTRLEPGDAVLLTGGLGAGKTLLTKGILEALGFDVDEVTSPSFTLVNLYKTESADVYHIDLWRIDQSADPRFAVGPMGRTARKLQLPGKCVSHQDRR